MFSLSNHGFTLAARTIAILVLLLHKRSRSAAKEINRGYSQAAVRSVRAARQKPPPINARKPGKSVSPSSGRESCEERHTHRETSPTRPVVLIQPVSQIVRTRSVIAAGSILQPVNGTDTAWAELSKNYQKNGLRLGPHDLW